MPGITGQQLTDAIAHARGEIEQGLVITLASEAGNSRRDSTERMELTVVDVDKPLQGCVIRRRS